MRSSPRPIKVRPNQDPVVLLVTGTYLGRYLLATRAPSYSLLFLLPLILAYELLALVLNVHHQIEVRNGADVFLQETLSLFNIKSLPLALVLVLVTSVAALVTHLRQGARLKPHYFVAMVAESSLWALVIGAISQRLLGMILSAPVGPVTLSPVTQVMLYLGAGVYEELVFRVLFIGLFFKTLRKILKLPVAYAQVGAMVFASILFSGFHHMGVMGEPFFLPTFLFRFFAGLVLSSLYIFRGFGITAWAHTLYDLFLYAGWI